jgi:hypothetical protein
MFGKDLLVPFNARSGDMAAEALCVKGVHGNLGDVITDDL